MPALSWRIGANLDDFKKQMNETSSLAKSAARKVAQHFLDVNKELAGSAATAAFSGAASGALKLAGRIALVVGAAKLMGDAIGAARDQLADMVELQNKSQNVGVSSSFFQKVSAETKKLQVDASDLENALSHAFNATKDKAPIDLGQWETGEEHITEVEKALRVYNATVANGKLDGLVLFRDADTQEKKIEAVLKAMIQLESIGQKAASLDLGEKMFGSAFVDRIRQGRTSAESLLGTIQKASGDADGIFPDALVQRAKEMDDQLKVAHQRLSTALKPSWDDLADVLLTIKGYWASTVDLIAKAVELSNQIKIPGYATATLDDKIKELAQVNAAINGTGGGIYGSIKLPALSIPGLGKVYNGTDADMAARRDQLQKEIAAESKGEQYGPFLPTQSRGTGDAPTKRQTGSDTDRFDTSAGAIEKRTAALQAEAAAIDLGTEARDKAKIAAQLEAVAKQANAAAGLGENVVTAEQRKVIDEVSEAYGKAAVSMEKAKIASQIKFDQKTAFLSQEDVAIASQLKGIYPDVATALNSVEAAGMRAANGMRELGNLGRDVNRSMFVEFGQNLRNGMSAWDAFKQAGVNALGKIADKLMEMAANKLWDSAFSSSGGGLAGGLLSGIGKLFGFDDGGYTGPGGKTQAAGIVHKGEVVFSQADVKRAGGVDTVEAMRKGAALAMPVPVSGSSPINISGGTTTININGNADDSTVATMQAELAKRDAAFNSKVVAAIQDAKKRRQLA
ncbi:Phage-related minor tail protein [Afipia felis]|uniref:Phage-related minor tail protein n=1 Tax=Afipia felis TaxID=1035 RepID=A0A090N843_AFIFE|nr:hypothetical protein [Afipia felis]CEG09488.1 Phage-related minor tail protein [Afipia felis]